MPKILPVPHLWYAALYLLPFAITAGIAVWKIQRVPKKYRTQWLGLLAAVLSCAGITMGLMRF
jgi:hypothetical protein